MIVVSLIVVSGLVGWALGGGQRNVPEEAKKIKSPIDATAESIASGKKLFDRQCSVCHGDDGKGNTDMVGSLPKKPADLTRKEMEAVSDGEIFWLMANGLPQSGMPSFRTKLSDNEKWQVVAFVRNLSKPKP
jgi:mono/diheme cytochrome c family protein